MGSAPDAIPPAQYELHRNDDTENDESEKPDDRPQERRQSRRRRNNGPLYCFRAFHEGAASVPRSACRYADQFAEALQHSRIEIIELDRHVLAAQMGERR